MTLFWGDSLVAAPAVVMHRATASPADQGWPSLVQLGKGRAG